MCFRSKACPCVLAQLSFVMRADIIFRTDVKLSFS